MGLFDDENLEELEPKTRFDRASFEPGEYPIEVNAAEWRVSRSGNEMLVTTWEIKGDSEAAGQVFSDFTVLSYRDRATGRQKPHWNIPKYFEGASVWPDTTAERNALVEPPNFPTTKARVVEGLVGKTATGYIDKSPYQRDDGETGYRLELKRFRFETPGVMAAASDITF